MELSYEWKADLSLIDALARSLSIFNIIKVDGLISVLNFHAKKHPCFYLRSESQEVTLQYSLLVQLPTLIK